MLLQTHADQVVGVEAPVALAAVLEVAVLAALAAAALVAAVPAAHGRKRKVFLIVIIFNGIAI